MASVDLSGPFDQPDLSSQDFSKPFASFDPLKAPDYSKQGDPNSPTQDPPFDSFKEPPYEKQDFDPSSPTTKDDFEERPSRIDREPSGATGVRSSSISQERNSKNNSEYVGDNDLPASQRRVISPSRAMGARSGTIGRRGSDGAVMGEGDVRGRRDINVDTTNVRRSAATGFRSPSRD